jgi:hypothetical protein
MKATSYEATRSAFFSSLCSSSFTEIQMFLSAVGSETVHCNADHKFKNLLSSVTVEWVVPGSSFGTKIGYYY